MDFEKQLQERMKLREEEYKTKLRSLAADKLYIVDEDILDDLWNIARPVIAEREAAYLARTYTAFLYVEDGSVDYDELVEDLALHNPGIKVILYRQGSAKPELITK